MLRSVKTGIRTIRSLTKPPRQTRRICTVASGSLRRLTPLINVRNKDFFASKDNLSHTSGKRRAASTKASRSSRGMTNRAGIACQRPVRPAGPWLVPTLPTPRCLPADLQRRGNQPILRVDALVLPFRTPCFVVQPRRFLLQVINQFAMTSGLPRRITCSRASISAGRNASKNSFRTASSIARPVRYWHEGFAYLFRAPLQTY